MKNKILFIVLIILFVFGMFGINYFINKEAEKRLDINTNILNENIIEENDKVEKKKEIVENNIINEDEIKEEKDIVIEVTEDNFNEEVLMSSKKVLIDFYADWCGPCKMLSPIVENVARKRDDVKFVKINVDNNYELANKYEAYSIPLLVIIKDGEVVNKSIGLINEERLLNFLDEEVN